MQGTWTTAFDKVDLLEVKKPYAIPFPRWMLNYRIKEMQSFCIQNEEIFLYAFIANFKFYCVAEVFLLDKQTREKIQVFKVFPLSVWKMPQSLNNSSAAFQAFDFSFRIHAWLDSQRILLDLDIEPSFHRLNFTAQLEFDLDIQKITPMTVNVLFNENRSAYTYKGLSAVRGNIVWGNRRISLHRRSTTGLFRDQKGFYPYITKTMCGRGFGLDAKNRRFGFSLADNMAKEPNRNNENALWLDGTLTPLPPVRITQAITRDDEEWIIQDLEGMVDLTFKPLEPMENTFEIVLSRLKHQLPIGYFNGMLLTKDGEQLPIRNLWGSSEKLSLRI
ncbi:hypothetical protein AGMMS50212_04100 [Spirochaetia bacterium]|nr:hypothetical protein AGMMS50212_04100 [Spirochaetia bacterium]